MLEIGSLLDGKYRILKEVGSGGMSVVYMAMNEKANKTWAVKEVRKDGKKDFEIVRQGLVAETDILKKLNHPNLPSIIDVIDGDGAFLIVMDYIEGISLQKALEETGGAQPQEYVIEWAKELCDVLGYLHANKIIYRDMKPSNVMLKPDGHVTLIDFGTAREFKESSVEDTKCLGTVGYAAPEQYGGQGQTDARTDIYCLGATMYHLITGNNPSEYPYEMYPIRQVNPALSPGIEKIILKCIERTPEMRYQSCAELLYDLENYVALDDAVIRKNKKKMSAFLCTSVLTLLLAGGSLFGYQSYASTKANSYDALITSAENTEGEEAWENYKQAVALNPTDEKVYMSMLNKVIGDNLISSSEDTKLAEILRNRPEGDSKDYKERFKEENPTQYMKFAYQLGRVYWFGYEEEANRMSMASQWFDSVRELDIENLHFESTQDEANKAKWKERAEIFCSIAENSIKLGASDYDPSGEGGFSYSQYLEDFSKLIQDFKPADGQNTADRIAILYIYRQLVSKIIEKCKEFKNDNIAKSTLNQILDEIQGNTEILSQSDIQQEVQILCNTLLGTGESTKDQTSISQARKAIEANYR